MFSQYPYEGHQNPAIHWDNNDIVDEVTPGAVEVNGNFSYFNDGAMALQPEERLVVANFMCGLSEAATEQTLEQHVADKIAAIGLVEHTYLKFGVASNPETRSRRQERLVARAHISRTLDSGPRTLPMPEDWQQPFRDLVLMLASEFRIEQLSKLFQLTNAENHLVMATNRVAESLGLAHLEKGGPTLVALAANLLPDSVEAIGDRIYSPLTDEERSLFETLPPRGGHPLLPIPSTKRHAPAFESTPLLLTPPLVPLPAPSPDIMLRPPAPDVTRALRVTAADSQPGKTSSRIVRPHDVIKDFRNKTLWFQFEGGSTNGANTSSRLGQVSLMGMQHAKIQVGPVEIPGQTGKPMTNAELAIYCARVLALSINEIEAIFGVNGRAQSTFARMARSKIGLRTGNCELGIRLQEPFDVSLSAAFEEPQLLRTLEPPQFDGLEREQELLMEFGPHLISRHTRRDLEYSIITSREDRGYPRKLTSTTAIERDMDNLRTSLNLNTLGLKMLYLVHMDYLKQQRARAETFFAQHIKEN